MTESVEFDEFVCIAYGGEVAQELAAGNDHRGAVVVGVERIGRESLQIPVQKQVYVALRVVDQPEGRHRAGTQSEPALHALFRRERELALPQAAFEVVDGEVLLAVERHEVVAVSLVVAEKEVLAVLRAVVAPVSACDFDGRGFGVFVPRVGDAVAVEPVEDFLASVGRGDRGC